VKNRTLATLVAVVALVAAACGSAATAAPTPALTAAPSDAAAAAPTAASTATPAQTVAPTPASTVTPTGTRSTGQLTHGRSDHTATALADGRVLLAGGYWDSLPIALAEVYDPATDSFAATGSLPTARAWGTATRLSDGRVLYAGGDPGVWDLSGGMLASAELYDPRTGTFTPTGSMATGRNLHTATVLRDGRVLVTGGSDGPHHALASAELYDPKTGKFSPTGSMKTARSFHTATLLADGRVLVTGGSAVGWLASPGDFLASAEVYDPKTGRFSPTGSMAGERVFHTATLLADRRVLVTGGAYRPATDTTYSLASAELYDPKTGTFSPTGSMADLRTFHEATLLADSRVLVTGGDADGWTYSGSYLASAEIYDPKIGGFTSTGPMADAITSHTATLLPDGRVIVAGGFDGKADVDSSELYDPTTGTFSVSGPGG